MLDQIPTESDNPTESNNSPYANTGNGITWKYGKGYIRSIQRLSVI